MNNNQSQYNRMINTSIPKLIIYLSIPTIISMLITNIYNLVDTAFVGRLGTSASGAVGIVFGFMAIIQAFGFMYGQGAGSIVSRALGRRDINDANLYTSAGFFGSFLSGLLITILGFIWLDNIIYFLGSTTTIFPYARDYITYILIAAPFMTSSLTLNNLLRYEGKAFLGMIGLLIGALLNMIGDPILMFGLNLGISGAGISTAFSQFISWLILLSMYIFKRTEARIIVNNKNLFSPTVQLNIATTGLPSLLRQGLNSFTTVLLNVSCAVYGDAAVAAMSITNRISFFTISVILGINQGFQPVSGFNYGAGQYKRLRTAYYFTTVLSEVVMIIQSFLLFNYSDELIAVFRDDPEVIKIGIRAVRLQAIAQLFIAPSISTEMLFQSIGSKVRASILSVLRNGVLFIPLLLILAYYRGLNGIEEAQPLAIILTLPIVIPFIISFMKKLPKTNKLQVS